MVIRGRPNDNRGAGTAWSQSEHGLVAHCRRGSASLCSKRCGWRRYANCIADGEEGSHGSLRMFYAARCVPGWQTDDHQARDERSRGLCGGQHPNHRWRHLKHLQTKGRYKRAVAAYNEVSDDRDPVGSRRVSVARAKAPNPLKPGAARKYRRHRSIPILALTPVGNANRRNARRRRVYPATASQVD
jgi:hypothetical protein